MLDAHTGAQLEVVEVQGQVDKVCAALGTEACANTSVVCTNCTPVHWEGGAYNDGHRPRYPYARHAIAFTPLLGLLLPSPRAMIGAEHWQRGCGGGCRAVGVPGSDTAHAAHSLAGGAAGARCAGCKVNWGCA